MKLSRRYWQKEFLIRKYLLGVLAGRMTGNENAFWLAHGPTGNVLFGDFHVESIDQNGMTDLSNSLNRADGTHGFLKGRTKKGLPISH